MRLFDDFEAGRFPEENLIFITERKYLYYIYNPESHYWRKHGNAGNDCLTVKNYGEISKEELAEAMGGKLPESEIDFIRCCNPARLPCWDLFRLIENDYPSYSSVYEIHHAIRRFMSESDICFRSYDALRKLLDNAVEKRRSPEEVLVSIKDLSLKVIGRDIFKREIGIVDGHDSSSYFWIMPARVIDNTNTNDIDTVAEMRSCEISIEENDVAQYLTPFLYKYFDAELGANKNRVETYWKDDDGNEEIIYVEGFEWYLTHNFYTFDSTQKILRDIQDTIDALSSGRDNEYTQKLREKRGMAAYELLYARDLTDKQVKAYNENRPQKDDTEIALILDFYRRFLYRMEYMMRVGAEKGYDLISFMGP